MAVYIALGEDDSTAKIGSSYQPARRVAALTRDAAQPMRLVREVPGGLATERWFQKQFKEHRLRGRDWFRFTPEMLTVTPPEGLSPREHPRTPRNAWKKDQAERDAKHRIEIAATVPFMEALCGVPTGTFASMPAEWQARQDRQREETDRRVAAWVAERAAKKAAALTQASAP